MGDGTYVPNYYSLYKLSSLHPPSEEHSPPLHTCTLLEKAPALPLLQPLSKSVDAKLPQETSQQHQLWMVNPLSCMSHYSGFCIITCKRSRLDYIFLFSSCLVYVLYVSVLSHFYSYSGYVSAQKKLQAHESLVIRSYTKWETVKNVTSLLEKWRTTIYKMR